MVELNKSWQDIMNEMNYNLKGREKANRSLLPEIEKKLMIVFSNMNSKTSEMESNFNADLVTSSAVLDNPEIYQGLDKLKQALASVNKENIIITPDDDIIPTMEDRSR